MAATQTFTNSGLVSYIKLSPNNSGLRNHDIDVVCVHTMAGNLSVESCGALFAKSSTKASSNYGIGSDGRIALYVEEKNRSWCTSSKDVDNRAVTIEVAARSTKEPFDVTDKAWDALIDLLTDICRRNNINKLMWTGSKANDLHIDIQNMSAHRFYAKKSCPGSFLFENMGKIAEKVNNNLNSNVETIRETTLEVITGETNDSKIWNFLMDKIGNAYGVAGLMGNLYAESTLIPINLQNTFEKKLGMGDEEYTQKVDSGSYTNFVKDGAGYGLAQWTYNTRKKGLYDLAKSKNKSIGDLDLQLEYLWKELSSSFKSVVNSLKKATSVRAASDIVLTQFEKPLDQSETMKKTRANYGMTFYNKFAPATNTKPASSAPATTGEYKVRVTAANLNIRKGPGTNYPVTGCIKDKGVYTITKESAGKGAKKWGCLKSGMGWISLDYCTRV